MKQMATLGRLKGGVRGGGSQQGWQARGVSSMTKERLLLLLFSLSREGVASSEQSSASKTPSARNAWGETGIVRGFHIDMRVMLH